MLDAMNHALRLPDRHRPLTNLSRPVKRFRHASAHHEHRAVRVGQDLLRPHLYSDTSNRSLGDGCLVYRMTREVWDEIY